MEVKLKIQELGDQRYLKLKTKNFKFQDQDLSSRINRLKNIIVLSISFNLSTIITSFWI